MEHHHTPAHDAEIYPPTELRTVRDKLGIIIVGFALGALLLEFWMIVDVMVK